MRIIFKTKSNELRVIWKLLLLALFLSLFLVISAILMEKYSIDDKYGLLIFAAFILGTLLSLFLVERKSLKDLGFTNLKRGIYDILTGLLLGGILVIINVLVLYLMGNLKFVNDLNYPNTGKFLLEGFLVFSVVAIGEEMLFRGYIMLSMRHMKKPWLGILFSAMLFALLHGALNDGASIIAITNIFLAGIMLACMLYKSNGLYLPIGVHITWNYFQGYIFGVNVSGRKIEEAMYTAKMEDNLFTGGIFGLEGGLVNTLVMLFATAIIFVIYRKENRKVEVDNVERSQQTT